MARKQTGQYWQRDDVWYGRVSIAKGKRKAFRLAVKDEAEAAERTAILAKHCQRLRDAGFTEEAPQLLEAVATRNGRGLDAALAAIDVMCAGHTVPADEPEAAPTIAELGSKWYGGGLARDYPGYVRSKTSSREDRCVASKWVDPVVGSVPVNRFTLEHAMRVMAGLPAGDAMSDSYRRKVAQYMHKLLSYAVFPLRLIEFNPLPKQFLPTVNDRRPDQFLLPEEEAALLGTKAVPLVYRLFYGFTAREGGRKNEFRKLRWRDVAADILQEDANKTRRARLAALEPDVRAALNTYRKRFCPNAKPDDFVFVQNNGRRLPERMTEQFHEHLQKAGGMRPALFEDSDTRKPIRVYDLRATFVTIRLVNGWSSSRVRDKTGHANVLTIERYRRAGGPVRALKARTTGLRDFVPLDQAIPELATSRDGTIGAHAQTRRTRRSRVSHRNRSVSRDRIELSTRGFSVHCSTD